MFETGSRNGLVDVTLEFVGVEKTVRTDSSGVALFRDVPTGRRELEGRRLGYSRAFAVVDVQGSDTTRVMLFMRAMSTRLPEVIAKEKATPANLREFEQRRKYASGRYITPDQIDADVRAGADLNSLVARIGLTADDTVYSRHGGGRCPLTVYWNGLRLRGGVRNLQASDLAGVEYYTGPFIPVQYRTNAKCGVILFWTK